MTTIHTHTLYGSPPQQSTTWHTCSNNNDDNIMMMALCWGGAVGGGWGAFRLRHNKMTKTKVLFVFITQKCNIAAAAALD